MDLTWKRDWPLAAIIGFIMLLIVWCMSMSREDSRRMDACRARGGVPVEISSSLCFSPDVLR